MTFLQIHWHLTGCLEIWHVVASKFLFQILHSILELPAPSFMFPSHYVLLYYCAYSILTYTQTPHSVILWPLPVTQTLSVTWTCYMDLSSLTYCYVLLSVISWPFPVTQTLLVTWTCYADSPSFIQHHFTVDFLCLLCAYGQLICHFSYLQHQWTSLFSLILLRALLQWFLQHFWGCFDHWVQHLFYFLDHLLSFSAFLASSTILRLSWLSW